MTARDTRVYYTAYMPQKTDQNNEVVDMVKQYGSHGPASGLFQYAHHDEPEPAFDLTQWIVASGFAKDRAAAQQLLTIVAAVTIALSALLYWLSHNDKVPPLMHRPAIDARAHSKH